MPLYGSGAERFIGPIEAGRGPAVTGGWGYSPTAGLGYAPSQLQAYFLFKDWRFEPNGNRCERPRNLCRKPPSGSDVFFFQLQPHPVLMC